MSTRISMRRRFAGVVLLLSAAFLLGSCGYRPIAGKVPGGVDRVCVPVAKNQSAYPGLAAPLTSAIRKRLAAIGIKVVNDPEDAALLEVVIVGAAGEAGMVGVADGRLAPVDTVWKVSASARLLGPGGEPVATPDPFDVEGRALATDRIMGEEALGQRARVDLLDDLADLIVTSMFE